MTAVTFFRPAPVRHVGGLGLLLSIARPILLLAALAFFAGFGGYLILGPPQVLSAAQAHGQAPAATVATPAADVATPASDNAPKPV